MISLRQGLILLGWFCFIVAFVLSLIPENKIGWLPPALLGVVFLIPGLLLVS
jgi:hypothetical protein